MDNRRIERLVEAQRKYLSSGATLPFEFRRGQLKKLIAAIELREPEILAALKSDLGKPEFEAFTGELMVVLNEAQYALRHLRRWMRPRRVPAPMAYFPAGGSIRPEPLGCSLIIAPWNYPFGLTFAPLVGAVASGCTAIVKPSELSPATSKVIASILAGIFPEEYVAVVEGGIPETTSLLAQKFDVLFYTGNTKVGKIVMKAAAENLTPLVLELGGKNPCIVREDAGLETSARRIVWAKFFNAGQTCIAPDYLLVHRSVREKFVEALVKELDLRYGRDASASPDYSRIVNERHVERLSKLLAGSKIVYGGKVKAAEKYFSPTVLTEVKFGDAVMQDEIFGPILPVIDYDDLETELDRIRSKPKPLAFYIFTRDKRIAMDAVDRTPSGGACVNDTIIHASSTGLPFGGAGDSGMGAYHGKATFDAFTHYKSVVHKPFALDLKMRYVPYVKLNRFLKRMIRKVS